MNTTETMGVSVAVITYNHANYIEQCLDSILAQRADFPFEIVVRDDASTDGTPDLLARYAAAHPRIVRLLDGSRNLGANRNFMEVMRDCRAPLIAVCEGDDYWLASDKLQVQSALFRAEPGLSFASHACRNHGRSGLGETQYLKGSAETIAIGRQDVLNVWGQFAPTASYMFRREIVDALPGWFLDAPVGDFFLEMYALSLGTGAHINRPMSAYRTFSENSWSTQNQERWGRKFADFSLAMTRCLEHMRGDVRFEGCNFSRKFAASSFNAAIGALVVGDLGLFRSQIEACWGWMPHLSPTQRVLYALRRQPRLARILYLLKRRQALRAR